MQNKEVQLFIFPYAGGSVAAFHRLVNLIDDRIDAITVEYAGRGTRAREPFSYDLQELMDDAVAYCNGRRNEELPFAVLGYSMGSIIAYETIVKRAIPGKMEHLFLSAEVSPKYRSEELRQVKDLTDEKILNIARRLGGLDERMLTNERFAEIYIKPMLSDYRKFFDYRFHNYADKIRTDATLFYCENDTPYKEIKKWAELIEGDLQFYELGKNHFFINDCYEDMARVINYALT